MRNSYRLGVMALVVNLALAIGVYSLSKRVERLGSAFARVYDGYKVSLRDGLQKVLDEDIEKRRTIYDMANRKFQERLGELEQEHAREMEKSRRTLERIDRSLEEMEKGLGIH